MSFTLVRNNLRKIFPGLFHTFYIQKKHPSSDSAPQRLSLLLLYRFKWHFITLNLLRTQAEKFQHSVCCASPKSANLLVIGHDADTVCVWEEESHAGGPGEGALCILRARAGAGQPLRGRHSEAFQGTEERIA